MTRGGRIPMQQAAVVVSCYPPAGQVTQAPGGRTTFYVVLEIEPSQATQPWQVALWHSRGTEGHGWEETSLLSCEDANGALGIQTPTNGPHVSLYFKTEVDVQPSLRFTVKFREAEHQSWRWVRDEQGVDDGIVISTTAGLGSVEENLGDIIKDLNPALKIKSHVSQSPRTQLWTIETTVKGADGYYSSLEDIDLGRPWGDFLRWFAIVRSEKSWLMPRQGRTHLALEEDAVMCSFLSPEGKHLVLLAVSGVHKVLTLLRSSDAGRVFLRIRNDSIWEETATVIAAVGDSFNNANAAAMYHARSVASPAAGIGASVDEEMKSIRGDVGAMWLQEWYDGLGFCTWNALGQQLSEERLFDAVDTLASSGVKISSLIIDDNWQSLDHRGQSQFEQGWKEFEADRVAFPRGLKSTIDHIRQRHPGIKNIAVWHAMLGYWGGIAPEGDIANAYKTVRVELESPGPSGTPPVRDMTVVAKDDVGRLFNDFYRFLASCGIDGVKTDVQSFMDRWTLAEARRDLITEYLDAWTIASLRYFRMQVISCMSQVPQIIFHTQLPRNRPAALCRNSQDFYPDNPSSHPWHIWANAHNSQLTQHLNILPDWDMFQTVHDYSSFHAAARCISGGPIYITDEPGKHNLDLIKKMTGVTVRGQTVIFRPSVVGKSTHQYTGFEDNVLLKVGSYHGASMTGIPLLGVFNVSKRTLTELIALSDLPGVHAGVKYVVRAFSSGKLTQPADRDAPSWPFTVSLPVRGWDILSAYPVSSLDLSGGQVYAANLGLLGKMTGAAAIASSDLGRTEDGRGLLDTRLKALGKLGVYISALLEMSIEENFIATIQEQVIPPHTVTLCSHDEHVLEIDVEAAWNEMGLRPGWSNEVEVKLFFWI